MEATIVAPVVDARSHALAEELGRDAIIAAVSSADVLRAPPTQRVYIFCFDAALATALAAHVVSWAAGIAGLLGVLAEGGNAEREELLAAGFDDVVSGIVSVRELSGRIRSVHRRITAVRSRTGRLRHGAFTLDVLHRALWTQGRTITLTSTELEVMRALILAAGRPLSRTDLLESVWGGADLDVTDRAVDNVILRLRRKLPQPDAIETVRGVGFRIG